MGPGGTRAVGRDAGPPGRADRVRIAGGRYAAPVRLAKAGFNHQAEIRKLVADGDMEGLGGLMRADPAADRQYREMTRAGELAEAAAEGKHKRSMAAAGSRGHAPLAKRMTPADVPEAEVQAQARRIRTLLAQKDHKTLEALRRGNNAAFQAGWISLALAGEVEAA